MTLMKLYFTPVLLLLALSCPVWVVSRSLPVTDKGQMDNSCVFYARMLLENITNALTQPKLFSGINCTSQNMELNLETRTPTVCSPQESCTMDIGRDLSHYYKFLSAQPDPDRLLGSSVLYSLRELMALVKVSNHFDERLSLCKVMKGFQVRTITINRAIGYMVNLGEHTN
ncbi:hypothetical protein CRENBAI_020743 [Crenichthys baileyi]|uniref:Zmp:0000001127 n=1 Tax=Crenichthys baileyi TaxID=28760 RepID=A0AAV9R7C3_9TELE